MEGVKLKTHRIAVTAMVYRMKASPKYTLCGYDCSDVNVVCTEAENDKVTCKKCIKLLNK